jgi:hypothetical protein
MRRTGERMRGERMGMTEAVIGASRDITQLEAGRSLVGRLTIRAALGS